MWKCSHAFAAAFEPRKSFARLFDSEKRRYRVAHGSELTFSTQIVPPLKNKYLLSVHICPCLPVDKKNFAVYNNSVTVKEHIACATVKDAEE